MCECCQMRKMPNGTHCGQPLPKNEHHVRTNRVTLQIVYDIYIEHFYLRVMRKGLFGIRPIDIYQLNNCPNCGANLFAVWDSGR